MNFNQLLKQAGQMQQKMQEAQEKMQNKEFMGVSGGGLVQVILSGKSEIRQLKIDDSLIKIDEKDILEDLIIAAFNDAKNKLDQESQDMMSSSFGNIPMPPGFKLPF